MNQFMFKVVYLRAEEVWQHYPDIKDKYFWVPSLEDLMNKLGDEGYEIKETIPNWEKDWSTNPPTRQYSGTIIIFQKKVPI